MWIDTNRCEESMHIFTRDRDSGKIVCLHSDDSPCEVTEYNLVDGDVAIEVPEMELEV